MTGVATKTFIPTPENMRRPAGWCRVDAWDECSVAPCGEAGQLRWRYASGVGIYDERKQGAPDISDCLVAMPKRFRLVVWEPLLTDAPGPHLCSPYCCYINTVIFYHSPYIKSPWVKLYQSNGRWRSNGSPGRFEEWDQVETRLTWDDQLIYRGLVFEKGGGLVLWTHRPGDPRGRRWWMRHGLRRMEPQP